ncbi:MAG: sulfotransferase, partial [Colwellia sp.]
VIDFINKNQSARKKEIITINAPYKNFATTDNQYNGNKTISDPDFFISGPPRSGTSLLTVLLSNHPSVSIAQDTSIFSEFKKSAIWLEKITQRKFEGNLNFEDELFELDKLTSLMHRPYNENKGQANLLFNLFYTCFIRFHAVDFFIPDPRKDRGTGLNYLNDIDFVYILKEIKEKNLPIKSLLNYIVNSIIKVENNDINLRGEKTPSHMLHSLLLRETYPDSKFINIIRNPLGYTGSRHQRFDIPIKQHCNYYRKNIKHMITNDGKTITIRYEDLIHKPSITLKEIYNFLEIKNIELTDNLEPGSYPKYVGKKIDKNRDNNNISYLTSQMKAEVKEHLKDIFELYYPESLQ